MLVVFMQIIKLQLLACRNTETQYSHSEQETEGEAEVLLISRKRKSELEEIYWGETCNEIIAEHM